MENPNPTLGSLRKIMIQDIIEACSANGLLIKTHPAIETVQQLTAYHHAPISLYPTPFPLHLYKQMLQWQSPLGCLVSNLTAQPHLIHEILE